MTYVCVDHVFGETSTTDQIYSTITKPIVHSVMQGFNGTYKIYTFHRFSHAVIVRCTVIKDTIGKKNLSIGDIPLSYYTSTFLTSKERDKNCARYMARLFLCRHCVCVWSDLKWKDLHDDGHRGATWSDTAGHPGNI